MPYVIQHRGPEDQRLYVKLKGRRWISTKSFRAAERFKSIEDALAAIEVNRVAWRGPVVLPVGE